MAVATEHPLGIFLAAPAETIPVYDPKGDFRYNPETQLPERWTGVVDHLEIVMSGETTGDPDTKSYTTGNPGTIQADYDTDDSGT